MKKIILGLVGTAMVMGAATSCSDFLDQNSSSEIDRDFVFQAPSTARAALQNAYNKWRTDGVSSNYYNWVVSSSDMENQPEAYANQINRWQTSVFYGWNSNETQRGTESIDPYGNGMYNMWTGMYNIIALCNNVINSFQEDSVSFNAMMRQTAPSELSDIYGEAITLRASAYFEMTRYYGDCAFQTRSGEGVTHLTNRDSISEYIIRDLERVIPLMYRLGESSSIDRTYMSRTYAEGLIGRIALWDGGYQTRRTDLGGEAFYTDLQGKPLSFEKVSSSSSRQCFYGRRSDWRKLYEIAEKYLGDAIANPGTCHLQTTDPRTGSRYGKPNPYQYVFQEMMEGYVNKVSPDEDVYEIPNTHANGSSEWPYAFGRPSNGGSAEYYPCKSYGQSRFSPVYYYGFFDPNDLRRDVTCTVTGSDGHGAEALLSFNKGSRLNGGIANNKWDENRMTLPWTKKQRQSGINWCYMRFSDIILMQAEVKAALGNDAEARALLDQIRNRAFGSAAAANTDAYIAKEGSLLNAIIDERMLEFGGEGSRKFDLIRTNRLDEAINKFHAEASAMIHGLKTQGYYTFANGNTISNYVWTKLVDGNALNGFRLTCQASDAQKDDPVLYPSWRGQNDDWSAVAKTNGTNTKSLTAGKLTNLAIKGLFHHIEPGSAEAKALEADGYTMQPWGILIWCQVVKKDGKTFYEESELQQKQYNYYVYNGYESGQPPIHLLMMGGDIIKNSNGVLHNGYGFRDQ